MPAGAPTSYGTIPRVPETRPELSEGRVESNPISQFAQWFEKAQASVKPLPHAMALATATTGGHPSLRMVLLKGYDAHGFVFYTNYRSRKAAQMETNPYASLVFAWAPLNRQVIVEGRVSRINPEDSDAYFATRPRTSQLGAWASPQSQPVASRAVLDEAFADLETRYAGMTVPRPAHWGGYRVDPDRIEFWQGRANRMHDRLSYGRAGGGWRIERLAP
jgi:pyridoxamine 5'-phosphate oxidase